MQTKVVTAGLLLCSLAAGCWTQPAPRDAGRDAATSDVTPTDDADADASANSEPAVFATDFDLATFTSARRVLSGPGTQTAQLTPDGRWTSTVQRGADGSVTRTLSHDGVVRRTTVWSADGITITADYDDDDDGRAEVHVAITRGPTVADQQMVVTESAASAGVISERRTYTRTSETMVHVTIERPSPSGTLTVNSSEDTTVMQGDPLLQPLDANGVANCDTAGARATVQRALEDGIRQGIACMQNLDPRAHRCLLDQLATHDVQVHCTSGGNLYAQVSIFDTLVGPIDGTIDIDVDDQNFFNLPNDTRRAATLFHELLHVCRGIHQGVNIGTGVQQKYSDPIAACAATCFGDFTVRDRCTCATCRGVTPCDPQCVGMPPCPEFRTVCANDCVGERTVFATMADCSGHCANRCKGGGCEPFAPPCSR